MLDIEERRGIDPSVAHPDHRRSGVERGEPRAQRRLSGIVDEIGLGEQQPVGDRHLFDRLAMRVERRHPRRGIDRREHRVEPVQRFEPRIGDQRVQDRRGVGEPGRLDHHAVEPASPVAREPPGRIAQRPRQIAADRAAQATAHQLDHQILAGSRDQLVIQSDRPEFVDDDQRPRHPR